MQHLIQIDLSQSEGALVRVLGLIERRGFQLLDLHLTDQHRGHQLALRVDGGCRKVEVLQRQLMRLQDVSAAWVRALDHVAPFSGDESPHQCVRALGNFGVRHPAEAVLIDRPPAREVRHV